jgi:hypothetical protein
MRSAVPPDGAKADNMREDSDTLRDTFLAVRVAQSEVCPGDIDVKASRQNSLRESMQDVQLMDDPEMGESAGLLQKRGPDGGDDSTAVAGGMSRWRHVALASALGLIGVLLFTFAEGHLAPKPKGVMAPRGMQQQDFITSNDVSNPAPAQEFHRGASPAEDYTVDSVIDPTQRPGGKLTTISWENKKALLSSECEQASEAHVAHSAVQAVLDHCSQIDAPKYMGSSLDSIKERSQYHHCTLSCEQSLVTYRQTQCASLEVELMPMEERLNFLRVEMLATSYCWDEQCKVPEKLHRATQEIVDVSQLCNGDADASRESTCTTECASALAQYQGDPCTAWALHNTPKPEDIKADFSVSRLHIHNMCLLVNPLQDQADQPLASSSDDGHTSAKQLDCGNLEMQANVSDAIFGIKLLCPGQVDATECSDDCRKAVLAFEYSPCVMSVLQTFSARSEEQSNNFRKNYVSILITVQHLAHLCVLSDYGIATPSPVITTAIPPLDEDPRYPLP